MDKIRLAPVVLALGALVGFGSACSDSLGPVQSELNLNRQNWEAEALSDYRYRYRQLCFCGPDVTAQVWIRVEGNEVVSATFVESGEPVGQSRLGQLPTIDGLFDFLQDAIDREAYSIEAEYHRTLGYPTDASIDYEQNVADEEQAFTTEEVIPLQL